VRVPALMLVTDRTATGGRDLVDVAALALEAGVRFVQLREKDMSGRALLHLAERLREVTARFGALLVVNERVDVAVACGADGVHLGAGAMPVGAVRGLLDAGKIVGVSTHTVDDVREALRAGVDYLVFGPVYETPSKVAFGAPQGLERLAAAVAAARGTPVFAIGGVVADAIPQVRACGAAGVAVIRAIVGAADPGAASRALLAALGGS
jgi:thiamine-phosphate pyrophosphorylase